MRSLAAAARGADLQGDEGGHVAGGPRQRGEGTAGTVEGARRLVWGGRSLREVVLSQRQGSLHMGRMLGKVRLAGREEVRGGGGWTVLSGTQY